MCSEKKEKDALRAEVMRVMAQLDHVALEGFKAALRVQSFLAACQRLLCTCSAPWKATQRLLPDLRLPRHWDMARGKLRQRTNIS